MDLETLVIKNLQEILKTLEAMTPLPEVGSPEAIADHEGWMKRSEQINDIARKATALALMTLPSGVAEIYNAVEARKYTLLLNR